MVCQSYTNSLFLGHVAIDAIAVGIVGDVVGSDSPVFHIVHMPLIIQESAEKSSTFFIFFAPRALGLPPLAVDPSGPTG